VPQVLTDISKRTASATLFGRTYAAPFGIAPMRISKLVADSGELALARAAASANVLSIISRSLPIPVDNVARGARTAWHQTYLPGDLQRAMALVSLVEEAGYDTLVVTVDVPVLGNRALLRPSLRLAVGSLIRPRWLADMMGRLLRNGIPDGSPRPALVGDAGEGPRDHHDWSRIELIRRRWPGRMILKGILHKHDAKRARESGVDGIILSNHGGRQLDGAVSPLRVLSEIAEAADLPVMIDGGIRRGTDVLKALALGAKFVFVGRPFFYAAAIGGEAGVRHGIDLLAQEIDRNMALLGINTIAEMRRELVIHRARA
jgi:L-lactate dehydrogenase (cytochrome)